MEIRGSHSQYRSNMAVIPQEMITTIGRAFLRGQLWLSEQGIPHAETVDVALAAETYRYFWKPKPVKTLLLIPRERITLPNELGTVVKSGFLKVGEHTSPNSFLRTPYCLGAGEPELVPGLESSDEERNSPIWHVLAELVQRDYSVNQPFLLRIEQKARILHELHRLGIWITHPSLHAEQNDRPLLEAWWHGPGREVHVSASQPLVVALGRALYDDLSAVGVPVADYLYHPQGMTSDEQSSHQAKTVETILRFSARTIG